MEFYVNSNKRGGDVLEIYTLFPKSFGANCYVLISDRSAAIIDPAVSADEILNLVSKKNATIESIILTHGHFDHVTSLDDLRDRTQATACIHKEDGEMLSDGMKNAHTLFFGYDRCWKNADTLLDDGDEIIVGDEKLKVISTPGHSKGSICLLGDGFMITGDTIFANGYGRYDLHGGDADVLVKSLTSLRKFDKSLTIYPGHGDSATLGQALDNILYY